MNVRKYRAETTRDALELVKKELGENAYVLETKRVKTGGFLGLRSRFEVEVSAATGEDLAGDANSAKAGLVTNATNRLVDLKDEAVAAPKFTAADASSEKKTISALASRAAAAAEFETAMASNSKVSTGDRGTIAIDLPKPRSASPEKGLVDQKAPKRAVANSPLVERASILTERDLELLRAEMREVKFSLAALTGIQCAAIKEGRALDLGVYGETVEPAMYDAFVELMTSGIASDLARQLVMEIMADPCENLAPGENLARVAIMRSLPRSVQFEPEMLVGDDRAIVALIGSTGVGKTTTAAKLAARSALYDHHRVELVTIDTYRIAAVEQLKTYAEIIGAGCHVVRSVLELEAVLSRLPESAKILIDTTGRNPHDLSDQHEFSDFLRRRKDIRKCLVVQATTHPLDASDAIRKFGMYGADCLAITKFDETTRPGAVLETVVDNHLPLAYLGTGQRVPEDLQIATCESLIDRILPNHTL